MKNFATYCALLISFTILGQTSGIKITNSKSVITETTPTKYDTIKKDTIYITSELISFNYLDRDKEELEKTVKLILDELQTNSREGDKNKRYSPLKIEAMKLVVALKSDSLKIIKAKQDSLYHIYVKDFLQYKKSSILSFTPRRSAAFFDFIYGNSGKRFQLLNNTGFSFGENTAAIYSELVSGNLGVFRVSLGSMVASSSAEMNVAAKKEEAFQRLSSYGGNTVLTIEYPLAYIHTRDNQYNLISRSIIKGAADFPEFGTATESFAGSALLGLDLYADASTSKNEIRFFTNFNYNIISGTSTFKENLGVNSSNFLFGQWTVGIIFAENIKLSFVITSFSSEENLRNSNVILGGQILH